MSWRSLWRNLRHRDAVERELDEEVTGYLDLLTAEKMRAGMEAAEARRAARIEFGGATQVKEQTRDARAGRLVADLIQDARYGARSLGRSPGFTAVAALALALGIGSCAAMYSIAYGVLLRPLPYPGAERVAAVFLRYQPRDIAYGTMSIRDFEEWRKVNRSFEEPSLFTMRRMDLVGAGDPEQALGAVVMPGVFSALRAQPVIGRLLNAGEDRPGSAPVAVIGEALWRRKFGGSPDAIGKVLSINGAATTIVGVMPGEFRFPRPEAQVWINLIVAPPTRFGPWFYRGVARLKPGATLAQAQRELDAVSDRLVRAHPYYQRAAMPAMPLRNALVGDARPALLVLIGAVGLVLLVAIVNVANLMLARATARAREMALRLSLGARRGRLVRQLLTESMLLAGIGAAGGIAIAYGAVGALRAVNPASLPMLDAVRIDGGALAVTVALALASGALFGLAPAWQSTRGDLNSALNEGGRGGAAGPGRQRARAALVVAEVALSLVLLTGAGLLLRSFARLQSVTGGFAAPPERILTMLVSPSDPKYRDDAAGVRFYERLLERARRFPGVEAAAVSDAVPPTRQGDADTFGIEGQTLPAGVINPVVTHGTVGAGFFEALRVPLVRGRYFDERDSASSRPVAIVSESLARRFLPGRDPIGVGLNYEGTWHEIVGVVGDMKYMGLDRDTDMAYYVPFPQGYLTRIFLVVRTAGDAAAIAEPLRRELQTIDPSLTLDQVSTMRQALETSVAQPRFNVLLLAVFAAVALALAAIGIYGVVAYSVAQRTREFGVRMALGASGADVRTMVLRQAARLALAGIGLGWIGALAVTRVLRGLLFDTSPTDPATFVVVAAALLGIALAAAYAPARRATRISPVEALR